jgi:sec-independent protein translocase protein TatA
MIMAPGFWQILIVLVIIILLFGTSKLKNVGSDLGSALKGFKKAVKEDDKDANKDDADFDSLEKPQTKQAETVDADLNTADKQANKD